MEPAAFRRKLLQKARPARELALREGDPGAKPVTKVSGAPWWPRGVERPRCGHAHPMVFVFQVFGPDIALPSRGRLLVSFHYCAQCALDGEASFGWRPGRSRGYDVSVFAVDGHRPDGLGVTATPLFPAASGLLRRRLEVPKPEDAGVPWRSLPGDHPQGTDDFDEHFYPGLIHVPRSKVGGWPSWVQNPGWPPGPKGRWVFVGQLDSRIGDAATWSEGGFAYLFCRHGRREGWRGELVIQRT